MQIDTRQKTILAPSLANSNIECYENEICEVSFGTFNVIPSTSSLTLELYVQHVLFDPTLYPFAFVTSGNTVSDMSFLPTSDMIGNTYNMTVKAYNTGDSIEDTSYYINLTIGTAC